METTNKTKQKLEILVVEDNVRHINDAKNYFNGREDVVVDYANTLLDAEKMMSSKKYDSVISDVFFPAAKTNSREGVVDSYRFIVKLIDLINDNGINRKYIVGDTSGSRRDSYEAAVGDWASWNSLPPSGLYIVDKAINEKIKIAVATDSKHHGAKCQPITAFLHESGIPFTSTNGARQEKNWNFAYNSIINDSGRESEHFSSYASAKKTEKYLRKEMYTDVQKTERGYKEK